LPSACPQYDGTGALERPEPVPFRLTRNLANFFTPFGVEGIFVTSLIAGAQVGPVSSQTVHMLFIAGSQIPNFEQSAVFRLMLLLENQSQVPVTI
jgi:hypothetical protein